jgi:hypothetical protein
MLGGHSFCAVIIEDVEQRARLWRLADLVFPAFASYRASAGRAGREIPILQLVPRQGVAHPSDR